MHGEKLVITFYFYAFKDSGWTETHDPLSPVAHVFFSGAPKHFCNWLCLVGRSVSRHRIRSTIHTAHLIGLLGLVQSIKSVR